MKRKTITENGPLLIRDYLSGIGIKILAKKYHHDKTNIRNFLLQNGIELKTKSEWNQHYTFDKTYFKLIDNHTKAYWLGFIYADGNLYNSALQIGLNNIDKDHLVKFQQDIKSNHPLYKDRNCVKLIIRNEELFKDLQKLGLTEKKSLTLKFPSIHIVPAEFVNSFMLGYFDGDGSIFTTNQKTWGFSVISTFEFCQQFQKILINNFIVDKIALTKEQRRENSNTWYLKIGGGYIKPKSRERIQKIYNFLYIGTESFLPRKKNKFINILSCQTI